MAKLTKGDGYGWKKPTMMTDAETGEIVYDNRDVAEMAKLSILRGSTQSDSSLPTSEKLFNSWFEDKFLMEKWVCPKCNMDSTFYKRSIYEGTIHPMDETKTPYVRCSVCKLDSPPTPYKDEAHKKECEIQYIFLDKYFELHYNNNQGKYDLIQQFIKDNNINLEQ